MPDVGFDQKSIGKTTVSATQRKRQVNEREW
jgi:hypothetical protein